MQEKQYAVSAFMDIQGALDPITFAAIHKAVEKHNAEKTLIKSIVNMQRCRNICLTYYGSSAEAKVVEGCPQGGLISPMVYGS